MEEKIKMLTRDWAADWELSPAIVCSMMISVRFHHQVEYGIQSAIEGFGR